MKKHNNLQMFYWIVFEDENKNFSKGTLVTGFNY